jgi:hypothetical protein
MSILKTTGLIAGHYECRSLEETLPVLAMEVVQQKPGEGQYLAPVNRFALQLGSVADVEQAHHEFSVNGDVIGITELRAIEATEDGVNFVFSDVDKNWWELTAMA